MSPGSTLGGFEIVKLLGEGGMGSVYLSIQKSMQRYVALKVLPHEMTQDKDAVEQFLREVKTTGRLQHPNIVTAFDAGEDRGLYYLAITYVDGETLESRIDREGVVPEKDAFSYVLNISDALGYALEKHKIIHRDIKPGNIMVNSSGEAFLMDLGIAMRLSEAQHSQEQVEGSPFYMSPEQTRGEKMDWRSDLYSLGASLYHMIVGVPPYDAPQIMKIVEMHSEAPFPEPATRNPKAKVSEEATKILRRMMAKNPSERFKSWEDFQKAVKGILKGEKPKKKKQVLKAAPKNARPHKKTVFPVIPLLNLLLILGTASLGSYYWLQSKNEKATIAALRLCEDYMRREKIDYGIALEYYQAALATSKKIGVSGKTRKTVADSYKAVATVAQEQARDKDTCEKASNDAKGLYSEATSLYEEGMKMLKSGKTDEGKFDQAEAKCKEALRILLSVLAPNPEEQERITFIRKKVEGLLQQVTTGRSHLAENAAKHEQNAKKNKQAAEYKGELAKQQERLRLKTLLSARHKDFLSAVREADVAGAASKAPEDFLKPEAQAFKKWTSGLASRMENAQKVWDSMTESEDKFAGTEIALAGKGKGPLQKIEDEAASIKIGENVEKVKLADMAGDEISPLVQKTAEELGGAKFAFAYFLSSGDFAQAKQLAPDDSAKAEVSATATVYIKARAKAELAKDKNSTLEKLKKDYGSLPEYDTAIKEARAQGSD
ncbi:MAG: hypothetical protein A2X49_16205 [Lentisphaerae bacterium GWF2_52_8]|nr:MAG: hypothetical protein A2X49_16205 [Lentisphaerae bacterium GWF2_52_8]